MSADNWAICPRCKVRTYGEQQRLIDEAMSAYGRLPADEYLRLRERAEDGVSLEETFREDYDVGLSEDGEFSVNYAGECQKCGLRHSFSHKEKVAVPDVCP